MHFNITVLELSKIVVLLVMKHLVIENYLKIISS